MQLLDKQAIWATSKLGHTRVALLQLSEKQIGSINFYYNKRLRKDGQQARLNLLQVETRLLTKRIRSS